MCSFIAKYVLFFANLLFVLAGLGLVIVGILVIVEIGDFLELIPVNINVIPISVIVLGSVIFIIAFFGCCGAIRESRCLLIMYAICMLILAALKIWLAVVIFQSLNDLQDTVDGWLNAAFIQDNLREGPFGLLEEVFRCCGTTGYESYLAIGEPVPVSCCANATATSIYCSPEDAFPRGCSERLGSYFETFGDAIGAVIIGVIIVELIACLLAFFLNHSITSSKRRGKTY